MQDICPFCLSKRTEEVLQVKEMCKGTREVFDYAICASCHSPYIREFPQDISRYYEDYYSFASTQLSIDRSPIKKLVVGIYSTLFVPSGLASLIRFVYRNPTPWQMRLLNPNLQAFLFAGAKASSRILDVGCGRGQFVTLMRRFGYTEATGVDPFLEPNSGPSYVRRSDIHGVEGTYDYILFNHTLEHMPDPEAALRKARELLSKTGVILIQVPNIASREFATYKQDWCWMHAPFHYAIPSRPGVDAVANRCGLRVFDAVCTSRFDHYLYSDEYRRDISDRDAKSCRRSLENDTFDKNRVASLAELAYTLNKRMIGDWICYYLERV